MPEKNKKNKGGRKLFDGKNREIVIRKLEEVWAMGGTDREAAMFAGISTSSLSEFLSKNPEVSERKELLLEKPILQARKTVVKALDVDYEFAMDYLEKKRPEEFAKKNDPNGGAGGFSVTITTLKNDNNNSTSQD